MPDACRRAMALRRMAYGGQVTDLGRACRASPKVLPRQVSWMLRTASSGSRHTSGWTPKHELVKKACRAAHMCRASGRLYFNPGRAS